MTATMEKNNSDKYRGSFFKRFIRSVFSIKGAVMLCAAIVLVFSLYDFVILPRLDVWGATPGEIAMPLPGDALIPGNPVWKMNVAITIDATPEKIFPYFVQVGQDRGGFYSFDWLERFFGFGIYNTYTIQPQWQHLKAGDFVTFHKSGMGMRVHQVIPNRNITMITNGLEPNHPLPQGKWEMLLTPLFPREKGDYVAWNWDFNLFPLPDGKTRIVVRCLASAKGNALSIFFFKHAFALPSDVMDIEMLKRVKGLAEENHP
ncbi:hypothetical protein [Sodalis sp. dw_96]|uniref:hypothetical protein n=1 Tax=Sodalis sp. dw_96 TaxID=2719794 RepID=UPI001BD4F14A|nr:hypothetical protein [Sodalis sp. dw_96]